MDSTAAQLIETWIAYFTNSDTVNCPMTSCTLKNVGCINPYSGGAHLQTNGAQVEAFQNIGAGWTENVCVECTNDVVSPAVV